MTQARDRNWLSTNQVNYYRGTHSRTLDCFLASLNFWAAFKLGLFPRILRPFKDLEWLTGSGITGKIAERLMVFALTAPIESWMGARVAKGGGL